MNEVRIKKQKHENAKIDDNERNSQPINIVNIKNMQTIHLAGKLRKPIDWFRITYSPTNQSIGRGS